MCVYLPYLRGKQAELLAVREFAKQLPQLNRWVMPVIEPVKSDVSGVERAAQQMIDNGMHFALVLNPQQGDFNSLEDDYFVRLSDFLKASCGTTWSPAYLCREGDAPQIQSKLQGKKNALLVFQGRAAFTPSVQTLAEDTRVTWVLDGTEKSRGFSEGVRALNHPHIALLEDAFNRQERNADYAVVPDEPFSETPWYFKDDGYHGVADFTVIPRLFRDGGMLPYAVAIHMTYRQDRMIRIHHFVSDSNRDQSNIRGKFSEAATKIEAFYQDHLTTTGVRELLTVFGTGLYPGLGTLKKWSIKNHLEVMTRTLLEGDDEPSV